MDEVIDEPFTRSADYCTQSHIVAIENDMFIGGIELIIDEPELIMLFDPIIKSKNSHRVTRRLLSKAVETARAMKAGKLFSLIHKSNERLACIQAVLIDIGFDLGMEKVLFRRKPEPLLATEHDHQIKYRSLKDIGEDHFFKIFKQVYEPDIFESDPRKCFSGLIRTAERSKRFYPEDWNVAYIRDKAIGLTMPQLHDEKGELGSNYHIGVIHDFRGKGIGTILQKKAIMTLIKRGVMYIVGSTAANNTPMKRIFKSLHYKFFDYQYFYRYKGSDL
jgi:ribosomal protein S18 acetylase RimI-like enzyme